MCWVVNRCGSAGYDQIEIPAPTSSGTSPGLSTLLRTSLTQNKHGPELGGVNLYCSLECSITVFMYTCRQLSRGIMCVDFIHDLHISLYTDCLVKRHLSTLHVRQWWGTDTCHVLSPSLDLSPEGNTCVLRSGCPQLNTETLRVLGGQRPCQALQDCVFLKFQPLCWVPSNLWLLFSHSGW